MAVNRAERKKRLQAEGKWDAFKTKRDELRASGKSVQESDEEAWLFVSPDKDAGLLPPVDVSVPDISGVDADDALKPIVASGKSRISKSVWSGRDRVGPREVCEWVFDNMWVDDITPADAPSAGAWGLLIACRRYPDVFKDFYRTTWPKILPNKAELDKMDMLNDDGRETITLITRIQKVRENAVLQSGS